jgi:hypothetical protein
MSSYIKWIYIVLKVICIGILWFGVPIYLSELTIQIKLSENPMLGSVLSVCIFLVGDALALACLLSDRNGRWTRVAKAIVAVRSVSWGLLIICYEISQSDWVTYWHPDNYVLGIGVLQFVVIDAIVLMVVFWTSQPDDGKVVHELE